MLWLDGQSFCNTDCDRTTAHLHQHCPFLLSAKSTITIPVMRHTWNYYYLVTSAFKWTSFFPVCAQWFSRRSRKGAGRESHGNKSRVALPTSFLKRPVSMEHECPNRFKKEVGRESHTTRGRVATPSLWDRSTICSRLTGSLYCCHTDRRNVVATLSEEMCKNCTWDTLSLG